MHALSTPFGRAAPVVVAVLLLTGAAASVFLQQTIQAEPAAGTPPATLAAGTDGSTTLGASATSATTTLGSLIIVGTFSGDVLEIVPGGRDLNVQVELLSENAVTGDSLNLELTDGVTTLLQVDVSSGVIDQAIGTALQLDAGGGNMVVHVSGTEALMSSDTVYTLQVVLTPVSGGGSEARYDHTLTIT